MRIPPEQPTEEKEIKRKEEIKVIVPKEDKVFIIETETGGIE